MRTLLKNTSLVLLTAAYISKLFADDMGWHDKRNPELPPTGKKRDGGRRWPSGSMAGSNLRCWDLPCLSGDSMAGCGPP